MTPLIGDPSALLTMVEDSTTTSKSPPQSTRTSGGSSSRLDQDSNATTMSTTSSAKPQQQQRRRVYFVEERNSIHEFQPIDKEDTDLVASLWQQPWEMYECKQSIKSRARQWRSTGLGMLLADTFHSTGDLLQSSSSSSSSNQQQQTRRNHPRLCQKQLNTFAQLPDEFYNRGVERYLSRQHDQERTLCKRSILREIVVQAQSLRRQPRNNYDTDASSARLLQQQQQQAEYLARFAQQLNRDATLFARRCGRADEVAARKGGAESVDVAYRLVDYLIQLEQQQQQQTTTTPAVMPTHERPAAPPLAAAAAVAVGSSWKKSPSSPSSTMSLPQSQAKPSAATTTTTTKVTPSGRRVGLLQARQA